MSKKPVTLHIGDILKEGSFSARILFIATDTISVCILDKTKLDIRMLILDDVIRRLQDGMMSSEDDRGSAIVDVDSLSDYERTVFNRNKEIVGLVTKAYGPDYQALMSKGSKPVIEKILSSYDIKRVALWDIIRRYLQSGCRQYSLVPRKRSHKSKTAFSKKTGNPGKYGVTTQFIVDDNARKCFDEAIKFRKSGRAKNLQQAFSMMSNKYYSTSGRLLPDGSYEAGHLYPVTERPTYRQLYYYFRKTVSDKELDQIKTSNMEVRNNKRLLLGSSLTGVSHPGDYLEGDAVEVDLSLISLQNAGRAVSRPVVYALRDVYTMAIVAISVGYDNNSIIGLTNLMLNLCDDKKEYCAKYGVTLPDERLWPSNFIPSHIRVDRGSDFKSKAFERMCNELNITRELVPGGTGSLKGTIEQFFHQMHSKLNASTENNGLIEKRFDSSHHKEAVLNITEFTQMLIELVLAFNQKHMDEYPLTKKMIDDHVDATPVILWQYGCEHFGSPIQISDRMQYLYTLMLDGKAKLTRKGISFKGLYYINTDDTTLLNTMYKVQDKRTPMAIRYDPRCAGSIYYSNEGIMHRADLIEDIPGNADYKNATFKEVDDYMHVKKQMNADARQRNDQINADAFAMIDTAVKTAAAKHPTFNSTKDIHKTRAQEQQDISRSNSITARLETEEQKLLEAGESSADSSATSEPSGIKTDIVSSELVKTAAETAAGSSSVNAGAPVSSEIAPAQATAPEEKKSTFSDEDTTDFSTHELSDEEYLDLISDL